MVIWSVQGLFLFVILLVCGAGYQIERDRIAGLAAFAVGAALLSAVIVAPAHAVYRNTHPLHEGRNFYGEVSEELTRQWHARVGTPLRAVGGDDALAFALAFYSPDHPIYERRLVNPLPRPLPRKSNFESGWVALCFNGDEDCAQAMQNIAERAPRLSCSRACGVSPAPVIGSSPSSCRHCPLSRHPIRRHHHRIPWPCRRFQRKTPRQRQPGRKDIGPHPLRARWSV